MGHAAVYVITGQLAAGKSTLARALLERHELGVHLDVDGLRELVVVGRASPLEDGPEIETQFSLALDAAASLARRYADAGFAVAIEGGIDPEAIDRSLLAEGLIDAVRVSLEPPLEVALRRNRERTTKSHPPELLEPAIRAIDAELAALAVPLGWTRIVADEPLEATVARVVAVPPSRGSAAQAS